MWGGDYLSHEGNPRAFIRLLRNGCQGHPSRAAEPKPTSPRKNQQKKTFGSLLIANPVCQQFTLGYVRKSHIRVRSGKLYLSSRRESTPTTTPKAGIPLAPTEMVRLRALPAARSSSSARAASRSRSRVTKNSVTIATKRELRTMPNLFVVAGNRFPKLAPFPRPSVSTFRVATPPSTPTDSPVYAVNRDRRAVMEWRCRSAGLNPPK